MTSSDLLLAELAVFVLFIVGALMAINYHDKKDMR